MSTVNSGKSRRSSMGGARQSMGGAGAAAAGGGDGEGNSDSIKVVCRFRPGRAGSQPDVVDNFRLDIEHNEVVYLSQMMENKAFAFDKVFGSSTTQQQMFGEVSGVVDSVMSGFNGTIMAYGQTSAGKSFSMEGLSLRDPHSQGIIPRCIDKLFDEIEKADEDNQFQVVLSFYEVYCEKIRDLLNPLQVNLKLREAKNAGFMIQDVTEIYCTDRESVLRVIEFGKANRAAAPTLMNAESSRSHSIVSILIDQKNTSSGRNKKGTLYLVDLAGSEKVSKTGASGVRLEEAKNINGSLTTLGMVINALCDGQPHIPYRDSKLTMILMDALGGNSKTTLIVCCNPEHKHAPETLSTLRFGERAKRIKNHAHVNEELSIEELKQLLVAARKEIMQLRSKSDQKSLSRMPSGKDFDMFTGDLPLLDSGETPVNNDQTAKERQQFAEEKESLLMQIAAGKAQLVSLEEELEMERMKCKDEQEQRLLISSESAALQSTIAELEDKLIKSNLTRKASMSSPSFYETPTDAQHPPSTPADLQPTNLQVSFDERQEDVKRQQSHDSGVHNTCPEVSMEDIAQAGESLNAHFEQQIQELTSSINEHEIETKTAQASAQNFAEKYIKLREEYELHVQRLMLKLTQEQQARTAAEEKLEEAYHKLWHTGKGKGGLWSWFSSTPQSGTPQRSSLRASSFLSRTPQSEREQNMTRALELAQFRISQLVAELEAHKEAQGIVLETKESVMRSLAKQNSQLTMERDQWIRRVEELSVERERLTTLVRDLQSRKDTLGSVDSGHTHKHIVKGGSVHKLKLLTATDSLDLSDDDDAVPVTVPLVLSPMERQRDRRPLPLPPT